MTSREHLERTERLGRALGRLRRAMHARAVRALEDNGDLLVHWQLISGIAYDDLHSQAALAVRIGMDPAGASRALDELEARGLVERRRDGSDRRRLNVSLTAKGRRWYDSARRVVFSAIAPLFDDLTVKEARQLEALLNRLSAVHAVLPT
jgi:DNA-binding MarR family transcriptional regulator